MMNRIMHYQQNLNARKSSSIFVDLAGEILRDFPHRLSEKTYLLIPDPKKELIDTAYEYYFAKKQPIPITLSLDISTIMNRFEEVAEELGFSVITSMSDYHGDGEIFDLLGISSLERGLASEEIHDGFSNVKLPLTLSVDDYTARPFLPALFKNTTANRGEDKYLIESEEQLKKIMALFELPESKSIGLKSEFIVQKYIRGFEGMNTSIRVITSCTGEILSSLFLISTNVIPKKRVKNFGIGVLNPCEYLNDPTSEYFLNCRNVVSNAASGGSVIPLNKEIANLSFEDEFALTLHDISVETLALPDDIVEQVKEIVTHWGSKKGIVLGIDFIYNPNDSRWYYLETNRNPSVEGYRYFMGLKDYIKKDVKSLMQLDSLLKIVEYTMTKDLETENIRKK